MLVWVTCKENPHKAYSATHARSNASKNQPGQVACAPDAMSSRQAMMVCMSGVPELSGRRRRPDRSASASDPRSQYCHVNQQGQPRCSPAGKLQAATLEHAFQRIPGQRKALSRRSLRLSMGSYQGIS